MRHQRCHLQGKTRYSKTVCLPDVVPELITPRKDLLAGLALMTDRRVGTFAGPVVRDERQGQHGNTAQHSASTE